MTNHLVKIVSIVALYLAMQLATLYLVASMLGSGSFGLP